MGLRSFINVRPPLAPGEQIRWQGPCLYALERATVGGTLFATQTELIFMPNRLSGHELGPKRIRMASVSRIGVMERTGTPYNGGLRRRVRVAMHNGTDHLLIMKHPDETAQKLRTLVGPH
jgi:hypothetical protein